MSLMDTSQTFQSFSDVDEEEDCSNDGEERSQESTSPFDGEEDSNGSSTLAPHPGDAGNRQQRPPTSIGVVGSFTASEEDYMTFAVRGEKESPSSAARVKSMRRPVAAAPSTDERDSKPSASSSPALAASAVPSAASPSTVARPSVERSNYGVLERCGRWLMSIPRDDVVALQRTQEYRDFVAAFDRLGEAHRRTVTMERRNLLEREDNDMADYAATRFASSASAVAEASELPLLPGAEQQQGARSHGQHPQQRRRYSFLQHLAVDDVVLRVFEFLDCSSLVKTCETCHRFRELSTRSAEQRTHRMADGRLLRSAMKMLRAQEQIEGVGPRESGPFVPIPMLGLRRRVKVTGAGDPEYNGIYFCTGSNGNGFLFTKPRVPERRVRDGFATVPVAAAAAVNAMQPIVVEPIPIGDVGAMDAAGDDANNGEDDDDAEGWRAGDVDVLFGDEPNRSRLLRCVIAKRFSNETILWYMSKEVEDEASHEISQMFSFWAKLMVTGDAPPDVCRYPSQTSILSRNGEPAWQPLSSTVAMAPPIVELLNP